MAHKARYRLSPAPLILAALLAAAALAFTLTGGGTARPATRAGASGHSPGPVRTTPSPSPSPTPPPLPACSGLAQPATRADYPDWRTTLLDTRFELPQGYVPPDLVSTAPAGFASEFQVRRVVLSNLTKLEQAASAAGAPLSIVAAYRSFAQQQDLLAQRTAELGAAEAAKRVAQPGHSEHQMGTAIDFTSRGLTDVDASWGSTTTGIWMADNAWRYGFVLSYPKGQIDLTCYPYEPWHFRYVGPKLAAKVRASGLTLREYLWRVETGGSA